MDDPISALDAHVRNQIIENVYFGALKDRTRILVTHAIDFLERADHIVMMEEGGIAHQGNYEEMLTNKEFQELLEINDLNKRVVGDAEEKADKEKAQGSEMKEKEVDKSGSEKKELAASL
jgi:ABC-type multidrug transport system ATPase subunit